MTWTASYVPDAHRIDLVIRGDIDAAGLRDATVAGLELVAGHDAFGVLVDCSELANSPLPSAVQRLPEMYAAKEIDRRLRIAVLRSAHSKDRTTSRFYKMAAARFDYMVELFDELDDALQWLALEADCR